MKKEIEPVLLFGRAIVSLFGAAILGLAMFVIIAAEDTRHSPAMLTIVILASLSAIISATSRMPKIWSVCYAFVTLICLEIYSGYPIPYILRYLL